MPEQKSNSNFNYNFVRISATNLDYNIVRIQRPEGQKAIDLGGDLGNVLPT
jgi:hypothetical protein